MAAEAAHLRVILYFLGALWALLHALSVPSSAAHYNPVTIQIGDAHDGRHHMSGGTPAEKLGRIEAILERVELRTARIEEAQNKDIADLAALKNRGTGILIGVAIAAGVVGAKLAAILAAITAAFK